MLHKSLIRALRRRNWKKGTGRLKTACLLLPEKSRGTGVREGGLRHPFKKEEGGKGLTRASAIRGGNAKR